MPDEISKVDIIESMTWMIEHFKWAHQQTGLGGDYSPELKKAILICDALLDEVDAEMMPLGIGALN